MTSKRSDTEIDRLKTQIRYHRRRLWTNRLALWLFTVVKVFSITIAPVYLSCVLTYEVSKDSHLPDLGSSMLPHICTLLLVGVVYSLISSLPYDTSDDIDFRRGRVRRDKDKVKSLGKALRQCVEDARSHEPGKLTLAAPEELDGALELLDNTEN